MLNTKLNLYNPDWIELVFANRNKSYGAFELRQHYGSTMVKAMGIAFTTVIAAALLYNFSVRQVVEVIPAIPDTDIIKITEVKLKKIEEPKSQPAKQQPPVSTQKFISFVVTSKPVTEDPPVIDQIKDEIGPVTIEGPGTVPPIVDPVPSSGGTGVAPEDKSIHDYKGLEVMPEPVGGAAAWSKFLNRNLRFPAQAQDAGKGGRVIVSFVIEKDGRLSDITVVSGAGYGMDEEATRVLKLAKPWKPGVQNGQPVRVRYEIPMNFQVNEE